MNEYYGAPTTPTSDYLAHYGVRGMKWGIRKAMDRYLTRERKSNAYKNAQDKLRRGNRPYSQKEKKQLHREAMAAGDRVDTARNNLSWLGKHGFGKTAKQLRNANIAASDATRRYYNSLSKKEFARLRSKHIG